MGVVLAEFGAGWLRAWELVRWAWSLLNLVWGLALCMGIGLMGVVFAEFGAGVGLVLGNWSDGRGRSIFLFS